MRIAPYLSDGERDAEAAEGTAEAVFEGERIRTLTLATSVGPAAASMADGALSQDGGRHASGRK